MEVQRIILLLEKDKVEIREELLERTKNQCETKIRQGEIDRESIGMTLK